MNIEFNADEILEMAEQIERNGAAFYRKAADYNKANEATARLLNRLAAMEDDHKRVFSRMRSQLSQPEWADIDLAPDNEVALYLRSIADGYVFNVRMNPADMLSGEESLEEILRTALKLEEDSIIFYLGMQDMVPADLGKDSIEHIIKEEKSHIVTLAKLLAAVS